MTVRYRYIRNFPINRLSRKTWNRDVKEGNEGGEEDRKGTEIEGDIGGKEEREDKEI
ncbi:MAG: hypothetical protein M1113_05480 [Candidatus Thermoplasmatota archaeon]|nr:hypothetical protein [Candidatus Thermoplasmatota archaeon]